MKVIQVVGYKNSGKTSLCLKIIAHLSRLGLKIAAVKRTDADIFAQNKDSEKFFSAGAAYSLIITEKCQYIKKPRQEINQIIRELKPNYDLLIIEGFKSLFFPRIVCFKETDNHKNEELLRNAIAIACDSSAFNNFSILKHNNFVKNKNFEQLINHLLGFPDFSAGINCKKCGYSCEELYFQKIINPHLECFSQENKYFSIKINDKDLALNPFMEKLSYDTFTGFLKSLKGFENGKIEITLDVKDTL